MLVLCSRQTWKKSVDLWSWLTLKENSLAFRSSSIPSCTEVKWLMWKNMHFPSVSTGGWASYNFPGKRMGISSIKRFCEKVWDFLPEHIKNHMKQICNELINIYQLQNMFHLCPYHSRIFAIKLGLSCKTECSIFVSSVSCSSGSEPDCWPYRALSWEDRILGALLLTPRLLPAPVPAPLGPARLLSSTVPGQIFGSDSFFVDR